MAGIVLTRAHRRVLATPWPWLGGVIALAIWAPNLAWQFANGWPQLTMASALHQQNTSTANYIAGLPSQLLYAGLVGVPLVIAGFGRLYRTRELRFLGIAATLVVLYVVAWVPGKIYYSDGMLPAVIAAGSVSAQRWIASSTRGRLRNRLVGAGLVLSVLIVVPNTLPVLPIAIVHTVPPDKTVNDSVGWPQLTAAVAAQDAALTRAGEPPTSIYTGAYAEAGALDLYGGPYHLPPVVSAHNSFWTWGPSAALDTTVLVVDAPGPLAQHFASCRRLTVWNLPDQVRSDWNDIPISVCTGPAGSWHALWPYLKHFN